MTDVTECELASAVRAMIAHCYRRCPKVSQIKWRRGLRKFAVITFSTGLFGCGGHTHHARALEYAVTLECPSAPRYGVLRTGQAVSYDEAYNETHAQLARTLCDGELGPIESPVATRPF